MGNKYDEDRIEAGHKGLHFDSMGHCICFCAKCRSAGEGLLGGRCVCVGCPCPNSTAYHNAIANPIVPPPPPVLEPLVSPSLPPLEVGRLEINDHECKMPDLGLVPQTKYDIRYICVPCGAVYALRVVIDRRITGDERRAEWYLIQAGEDLWRAL